MFIVIFTYFDPTLKDTPNPLRNCESRCDRSTEQNGLQEGYDIDNKCVGTTIQTNASRCDVEGLNDIVFRTIQLGSVHQPAESAYCIVHII